jgi:tripartite-type tricarboxylate transporter receptor subunit TctC
LLNAARSQPGIFNYGKASVGSAVHLATELFNGRTAIYLTRASYKDSANALIGLAARQVGVFASMGRFAPLYDLEMPACAI